MKAILLKTPEPYIPESITVHLGPPDSYAENVTISFPEYIKNVASGEIYPTWDEAALRANILAQISFALNRVYLEYYKSRGYNFDITNSTAIDQSYEKGRNIFENISVLVDELFTSYIRRDGFVEPLASSYCNGSTVTCSGLSQWGSEGLAQDGLNYLEILKYYYGDDIEIVNNAPIQNIQTSYPGSPLKKGNTGDDVITLQSALNRISQNYPLIPKIYPVDGIFGSETEAAVKEFQKIFYLSPDGIVGKSTWNKITLLYVGISRLSELDSEGVKLFGKSLEYPDSIKEGDTGEKVQILQYFLSILSEFNQAIPFISVDGIFDQNTKNAVLSFQRAYNLPETGVVNAITWNELYDAFNGIVITVFLSGKINNINAEPYGDTPLSLGSKGESVKTLQQYLNALSNVYTSISPVAVTGNFGENTEKSVLEFQAKFDLEENGIVDRLVWNSIMNQYKNVVSSTTTRPVQFPGYTLKEGDMD